MSTKNIIFGLHAVQALLSKHPGRILHAYLLDTAVKGGRDDHKVQKILHSLKNRGVSYELASRDYLDHLTQQGNHQGVAVQCDKGQTYAEGDLQELIDAIEGPPLLLILDGVQDPHNLGAVLRTADAAGVHAVIAPKDKSVGITPTVAKVACGAVETVPFVQVTNLARVIDNLKQQGIWFFGMSDDAEKTLYEEDLKIPLALVMGNEEKGMRHLTSEKCDFLLKLPMQGFVSSLNVSVATGICLDEVVRQRKFK